MGYVIVRRLDKLSLSEILKSLAHLSDRFSLNFPNTGYQVDSKFCEGNVRVLDKWLLSEKIIEFEDLSVKIKEYQLTEDSVMALVKVQSDPMRWSWDAGLPEDIILYRTRSPLPLFESYSLDKENFAVLNDEELTRFKEFHRLNSVQSWDLKATLHKKGISRNHPRILAVAEMYASAKIFGKSE